MSFSAPGSPPPESPGQPGAVPPVPEQAPPAPPTPIPPQDRPYAAYPAPAQAAYPAAYPATPYPAQPPAAQVYGGQPYPQPQYAGQPYPYPVQPYPAPLPVVDVLRSPRGLATALTVLLSVAAVVNLFLTGVCVYLWSLMRDLMTNPLGVPDRALARVDDLTSVADVLQSLILVPTMVVFLVWFHRVRHNGAIFRPDAFTLAPGWAIGGWFVPVANLVIPFLVAKQTWTASTQHAPDGSLRKASTVPLTAWWLLFAGASIAERAFAALYPRADTPEELRATAVVGAVDGLLMLAAAVLAIVFVRGLTAMQDTKAVQGPVAAV
ncbi:DUF4328 domain-containing protein [Streptomyces sp. APSN-46.1]|uniref:DUF4328 domain-containing protein n=1 Tax=Streptomyces sp. APSN-46.1 TaxID=2929049 RepID=UPI001FB44670|nr:DUF4328 domain-containing protein [Streptomyces sp. APSN-46.1]MCJ1676824.1 DUF4328 domain-containing protein [Streptomyces sp. APSN-46.1]